MGKVLIPIENHVNGLHKGHEAIIDFAKSFPGTHIVRVLGNAKNWRNHLLTGGPFAPEFISPKMNKNIEDKGCVAEEVNLMQVYEAWRVPMYNKATALVSLYKERLILDDYIKRAIAMVMGSMAFKYSTVDRNDIIIRGPEVNAFFQKSMQKLLGGPEIIIYPNIIKNLTTNIKEQGILDKIPSAYYPYINRLYKVIEGAKEYYKVGKNEKLVQELNDAYSGKPWTIKDIVVFDGGMVPGRMAITQFIFPAYEGTAIVEDIDYKN